jgi:hypothetical protein
MLGGMTLRERHTSNTRFFVLGATQTSSPTMKSTFVKLCSERQRRGLFLFCFLNHWCSYSRIFYLRLGAIGYALQHSSSKKKKKNFVSDEKNRRCSNKDLRRSRAWGCLQSNQIKVGFLSQSKLSVASRSIASTASLFTHVKFPVLRFFDRWTVGLSSKLLCDPCNVLLIDVVVLALQK